MFKKALIAIVAVLATMLALVQPASANISADHWDRTTVVIDTIKAGTSAEMTWQHDRINNMRAAMGSAMDIVEGGCQVNMPCIEVYWDFYGSMWGSGVVGLETDAGLCSTNLWCRYNGTTDLTYHTTIQFNRSYLDSLTTYDWQSTVCHELGHSMGLQHASGATCMQASGFAYITYSSDEITELRNEYGPIPR